MTIRKYRRYLGQHVKHVVLAGAFLMQLETLNATDDTMQGLEFMGTWRNYQFRTEEADSNSNSNKETYWWQKFQRTRERLKQFVYGGDGDAQSHHDASVIRSLLLKKEEVDQEMTRILDQHPVDQPLNFFWGRTGAGKTTLKDFFEEVDTLKDDETTKTLMVVPNIDPKCGDQGGLTIKGPGVGTGFKPETKKPTFSSSGAFLDLPGVEDISKGHTQKAEEEVQRAYYLKRILGEYRKFNLLVTVPESDLSVAGKGEEFLKSMQTLTTVFPEGSDYFDRTTFLVTHASDINRPNVLRNRAKLLLEGRQEEGILSERDKMLLEYINSSRSRICIAKKPSMPGGLPRNFVQCFDTEGKAHLFDKATSVDEYTKDIEVALSPSGLQYLHKLSDQVTTKVSGFFADVRKEARHRVRPLIAKHNGTAEELRNQFHKFGHNLSYQVSAAVVEANLHQLDKRVGEEFQQLVSQHDFMMGFLPKAERTSLDLQNNGELARFATQLERFGEQPVWDGEHAVSGYIVGAGDIQKYLQNSALNQLTACGFGALFLDQDLEARGKSLALFSPFWKVTLAEKRVINLNGLAGKDPLHLKAPLPGMDGEPGLPGQSGGHFYGMLDVYSDSKGAHHQPSIDTLTILVNGGKGGDGQHGGDGENGEEGKDGDKSVLQAVGTNKIPWYSWLLMDLTKEKKSSGSLGKPGKDSGRGGVGSIGGPSGSITFANPMGIESKTTYGTHLKDGDKGENGEAGTPGTAGKNGRIFSGEWGTLTPNPWKVKGGMLAGAGIALGFEYFMRDTTSTSGTTTPSSTLNLLLSSYIHSITGAGWPQTLNDTLKTAALLRPLVSVPVGALVPKGAAWWLGQEGWVNDIKEDYYFPPEPGKKPMGLNSHELIMPQRSTFDHLCGVQTAQSSWKQWNH